MNLHIKNTWLKEPRLRWFLVLVILAAVGMSGSCHYYKLEKQLSADHADFISKVRYIISTKEKRLFLDLPDEEKDEFIPTTILKNIWFEFSLKACHTT